MANQNTKAKRKEAHAVLVQKKKQSNGEWKATNPPRKNSPKKYGDFKR